MASNRSRTAPAHSRRWPSLAASGMGLLLVVAVPVAAVGVWLVLTDPAVAADVAATGDLWPLAEAIVDALGKTLGVLARYL